MDVYSDYVIIGIVEVSIDLRGGLLTLAFINRRLSKRVKLLSSWLTKLKARTSALVKEADLVGRAFYHEHLTDEIKITQQLFEEISPGEELGIHEDQEDAPRAVALRHMFLQVERNAQSVSCDDTKLVQLTKTLNEIVGNIKAADNNDDNDAPLRLNRVKSWLDLCAAALLVINDRSTKAEDALITLLQHVNSDLGLEALKIPDRNSQPPDSKLENESTDSKNQQLNTQIKDHTPSTTGHNFSIDLHRLKGISGQQKQAIANLLTQRNAAESDVTVKVNELQGLQRILKESELCVTVLEDELDALQATLAELTSSVKENQEMKQAISSLGVETTELLGCIETLGKENEHLRQEVGE